MSTETSSALEAHLGPAMLAAFDRIGDVFVFVKDAERRFVGCSEPFARLLGYARPQQLLGLRDEEISPEYLVEHYRAHDEHVISTGEELVDLVELVRNADGSYDWFLTTKTAIVAGGRPVGLTGVTRALTKRDPAAVRLLSLTPAVELISRDYARQLSVDELAATVAMSPSHFSRTFRAHFGASPHRYVRRVRLMAACDLLSTTSLLVSEIAGRCGFYDQSHLSNEFRKERGMTPAQYRARYASAPLVTRMAVARTHGTST